MSHEVGLFPPTWVSLFRKGLLKNPWRTSLTWDPPGESKAAECVWFLSFEDALWRYLDQNPPVNKKILVPSFFCTDVTVRLQQRGYEVMWYPLTASLSFDTAAFIDRAQKEKVGSCILYYPLGKRSTVPKPTWFRDILGSETLIIEDAADCLLEPRQIQLIDSNHIVIDSLRKLLPFQGARLFSKVRVTIPRLSVRSSLYLLKAVILHGIYSCLQPVSELLPLSALRRFRWKVFGIHSNIIGSCKVPTRAPRLAPLLFSCISVTDYKKSRIPLVVRFKEGLKEICRDNTKVSFIDFPDEDQKEVRFIVLRSEKGYLAEIADKLERHSIYVDIHFDDSPLGEKFDFLLLPLSPTLVEKDITYCLQSLSAVL